MANVLTPKFRVSYPNVFKAKKNDLNGKDEYSLVALFPKGADLSKLKAAAQEAVIAKFGTDKSRYPKNMRSPFRDQVERAKIDDTTGKKTLPAGYEEGAIFLNLKSAQKPGLINQAKEDIIDASEFYAGCWAHATINAYAYNHKGNAGVSFGLGNIQKLQDGDPLGSRTSAQDDFEVIAGADTGSTATSASDLF